MPIRFTGILRKVHRTATSWGWLLVAVSCLAGRMVQAQNQPDGDPAHVALAFSGGHDTDPRDRGRPVVLVAAALGVTPEVFREAFSHVHPAPAGSGPTEDQARQNKKALMDALGRYGVTNDKLDAVSNHYRYVRSRGELWPTKAATAYAVVEKGVVTKYVVTNGGSGYTSAPTVSVPGINAVPGPQVQLGFGKALESNGAVTSITAPTAK